MSSTHTELDELVNRAIETGIKIGRTKALGLTSNQGGIPHPDFYQEKIAANLVKKHTALLQKTAQEAELLGRIDEHHRRFVDADGNCGYCEGDAYSAEHDVRLAHLRSQHNRTETK